MTGVSWVMNGYNLVLTVLFLPMGRLADRFGHRRLFLVGLAVFTAASLGCALSADSLTELVALPRAQAIGAAAVDPDRADPADGRPSRAGRQGFAAGLFGRPSTLAAALGPTLGGLLIAALVVAGDLLVQPADRRSLGLALAAGLAAARAGRAAPADRPARPWARRRPACSA